MVYADNDGDDSNGRDGNGDSNGHGNDAATAADGKDVNEDDGVDSRTAI